ARLRELVESGEPFVYTSGQYPSEFEKTTVAVMICPHPKRSGSVFVYDLRHDPAAYKDMTPEQLADKWRWKKDSDEPPLPVKSTPYSRVPAVAPLKVLDTASQQRLQLDMEAVRQHHQALKAATDLAD